jgi:hypothetical protein
VLSWLCPREADRKRESKVVYYRLAIKAEKILNKKIYCVRSTHTSTDVIIVTTMFAMTHR